MSPDDLGFDAVIDLAAISNDPIGHISPSTLEGCYDSRGALLLFSSRCSLNGAARNKPVNATGHFNPVTPYGVSKAMA